MTRLPRGWVPPAATHQQGLFTAAQAWAAGATRRQVQLRLARGDWVHLRGDAIAPATLAVTPLRRATAITLTWPTAVACLTTAAAVHGLPVPDDGVDHALVDRRTRSRGGVRTHLRPLGDRDVVVVGAALVTSRRRTAVDCVGHLPDADSERLLAWCVTREVLRPADIRAALDTRAATWGAARLRRALQDAERGTLSAAERRLRDIARGAGLVGCRFDQQIRDEHGIVGRADALFRAEHLVIEVDGFAYHAVAQFQADRDKQNRLMLAGYTVLRFTWSDLTDRPHHVVEQIRATLAALRAE
ncbi:endonuclease domain-containing protein [Actinotalea solisilvae]|uniref:endonuclease domain-containing protein n=1 Tax=Actinotalea solisilvae TaxID=2072922 RepID=UPI0018F2716A|nr:DUF559 domain-containing protein [Actinotalea solisilvae]